MAVGKPKIILWKPGLTISNPQVYLDANFLVGLAWPQHVWHVSASAMQAHFAEQKTRLILSSLAMNEAIFQVRSFEQKAKPSQVAVQTEAQIEPETNQPTNELDEDFDDNAYADEPDLRQYRFKPNKTPPKPKPATPQWANLLEQMLYRLPNLAFFEPPNIAFHLQVSKGVQDFKLDPTDAFHYAVAQHLGCPLISNDAGFQKVPDSNLTVITFF